MLPAVHRLRHRAEFAAAIQGGRRASRRLVTVHMGRQPSPDAPRAGFVVTRQVGDAVTRNRVRRRLRHLVAGRLDRLPPGALLVVRASPPAATALPAELAADLDRALDRALDHPPAAT